MAAALAQLHYSPPFVSWVSRHLVVRVLLSPCRVEAFFTYTPLAGRMFHASTFQASLALPPTHPKFPLPAILHAMCALGSMYTAAVPHSPSSTSILHLRVR